MILKRIVIILAVLLAVLILAACVRSASTPPVSVVTPLTQEGEATGEQVQVPTNEVIQQLELFVTQTAAAQFPGEQVSTEIAPPVTGGEAGLLPTEAGPATTEEQQTEATAAPVGETQPTLEVQPTQAPAVLVPSPTPGLPKSYTIQSGEFLFCIARRFNVDPGEMMSLNGLSNPGLVRPGQELRIPQTGNPFGPGPRALKAHPDTYIVQSGDNLNSIACKYGDVSPEAIAYANGLTKPYELTPGAQLYIP